jgi:hypothetical protein
METADNSKKISIHEIRELESFKTLTDTELENIADTVFTFCSIIYDALSQDEKNRTLFLTPNNKSLAA